MTDTDHHPDDPSSPDDADAATTSRFAGGGILLTAVSLAIIAVIIIASASLAAASRITERLHTQQQSLREQVDADQRAALAPQPLATDAVAQSDFADITQLQLSASTSDSVIMGACADIARLTRLTDNPVPLADEESTLYDDLAAALPAARDLCAFHAALLEPMRWAAYSLLGTGPENGAALQVGDTTIVTCTSLDGCPMPATAKLYYDTLAPMHADMATALTDQCPEALTAACTAAAAAMTQLSADDTITGDAIAAAVANPGVTEIAAAQQAMDDRSARLAEAWPEVDAAATTAVAASTSFTSAIAVLLADELAKVQAVLDG